MIKLVQIALISEGVDCLIDVEGKAIELKFKITDYGPSLRGADIPNLTDKEKTRLNSMDGFGELMKTIWRFVGGESIELPCELF